MARVADVFAPHSGDMYHSRSRTPSPSRASKSGDDDMSIKGIRELVTKAMPHLSFYPSHEQGGDATPRNVYGQGDATPKVLEDGAATQCYYNIEEEQVTSLAHKNQPRIQVAVPGGIKLVFCEEGRGLPSLRRGWQTPDPEPMMQHNLPKCAALQEYLQIVDEAQAQVSTPQADEIVEVAEGGEEKTEDTFASTFVCEPCVAPADSLSLDLPAGVPSKGSLQHPHNCKQACKYFGKTRGCKDGANCDHCHLCEWKRGPRKHVGKHGFARKGLSASE
eukprot:TRINITY_DN16661_c0_g1_i1.p1 TRINITY_DN16661_c0_g1~~TRINITY_DN16661_c0_g1_i1.p1  ORF type:complete len:289 (+),score=66.35 TRINITY_DN16661_c0_g1_i1:40-867(+)